MNILTECSTILNTSNSGTAHLSSNRVAWSTGILDESYESNITYTATCHTASPFPWSPPKLSKTILSGTEYYSLSATSTLFNIVSCSDTTGITGITGSTGGVYTLNVDYGNALSFSYSCDSILTSNLKETKKEHIKCKLKQFMKSNLFIKTKYTKQDILKMQVSHAEIKARSTLRDSISEKQWRRYLATGFMMIQGESGKWYQVFQNQRHIRVYQKGIMTDRICIHTDEKCPPTDHVLNIMSLIQNDESLIWTKGVSNVYKQNSSFNLRKNLLPQNNPNVNQLSLVETYKQLKIA